jgi:ABC-2 type transport system ATP-binding protein
MSTRLHVSGLSLAYGARTVLRDLDLRLDAGELVGLIGPNGSGKSSLMLACAGLVAATTGSICIDGVDLQRDVVAARHRLGYAVAPERLPSVLRGRQCIELVAHTRRLSAQDLGAALSLCQTLGLSPWLERDVGEYSLGTRQKLAVALALIGDPPLLLLDEVLNVLDPLAAFALKEVLRERADRGAAVLLATHGLEVAERFLDRAVLLLDGRIVADWDQDALHRLRCEGGGGLEAAVVAHMRGNSAQQPLG